jgi:hypothetical protein
MRITLEGISPAVAEGLSTGMTETHRGATARITGIQTAPSTVVVRTQAGDLVVREHPTKRDVRLTISATASRIRDELYFHGERVQIGHHVLLDFGSVTVNGTVIRYEER